MNDLDRIKQDLLLFTEMRAKIANFDYSNITLSIGSRNKLKRRHYQVVKQLNLMIEACEDTLAIYS